MPVKRSIRQLHLILGLLSGIVVFIVSITGSIYCFEKEFREKIYKDLMFVEVKEQRLPLSQLMKNAKEEYPEPGVKNIRLLNDPSRSVEISLKNKESVFVDPYTGKVLGSFNRDNDFLGTVLQIHRSLYLGETGKIITGTSALIFILMLVSGIILWWPGRKHLGRRRFTIKRHAPRAKKLYDLHSVLGFYAAWILIFSAFTGIIWSFKWVEKGMYALTGSEFQERMKLRSHFSDGAKKLPVDLILERAGSLYRDSEECFINMPEDSAGVYKLTLHTDDGGFYKKNDQLFFDQYSGKLLKAQLFETISQGDRLKATNYNIHTGKVFGLTGQFMVFFAALISSSLPVTGFLMWRMKRKREN